MRGTPAFGVRVRSPLEEKRLPEVFATMEST